MAERGVATAVDVHVGSLRSGAAGDGRRYRNLKEWMSDPGNVYVGRGGVVFVPREEGPGKERWPKRASPFANPFKVTRERPAQACKELFATEVAPIIPLDRIRELKGKRLGCWCHPGPCHAQVLADAANSLP
mmetsp:Transcript_13979/g.48173  ORF Transcript_13979/g.48173 Transcript_13979/m.48173 type:complete len:132 (+) Transcript_13979:434-829(+)